VLIVGTSDGYVKLVDIETFNVTFQKKVHKMAVTSAMLNSEQKLLVTGSIDYTF